MTPQPQGSYICLLPWFVCFPSCCTRTPGDMAYSAGKLFSSSIQLQYLIIPFPFSNLLFQRTRLGRSWLGSPIANTGPNSSLLENTCITCQTWTREGFRSVALGNAVPLSSPLTAARFKSRSLDVSQAVNYFNVLQCNLIQVHVALRKK